MKIEWTFEELGKNLGKTIECVIEVEIEEPEPQTWDYPGSPGGIDIFKVHVTSWDNDTDVDIAPGSWQAVLDAIAFKLAEQNIEVISEILCEDY